MEISDQYLMINNNSIRYRVSGNGPQLLLVHGIGGFLEEWEPAMDILSQKFRVIALDLLGHGLSDKPDIPYTIDCLTVFLKEFIEVVCSGKIYLSGHSLGGAVCMNLVMKYPGMVHRLILINTAYIKIPFTIRLGSIRFLGKILRRTPYSLIKASARRSFYNKEAITARWLEGAYRAMNQPGALQVMFSIIHSNMNLAGLKKQVTEPFSQGLGQMNIPVLILCSERDKILPTENSKLVHQQLKHTHCIFFKNCGHELQYEQSARFCEEAFRFLNESP